MPPGVRPDIELAKGPTPEPSVVLDPAVVGVWEVLQQIPRAVTGEPPSLVTFPPPDADVGDANVTVAVVTVGNCAGTTKVTWFP